MTRAFIIVAALLFGADAAEARGYRDHHGYGHRGHGGHHFRGYGGHGGYRGGHRSHFSFNFGAPLWSGWGPRHYYAPGYYAPHYVLPAPVIIQQEPTVYIQRPAVVSAAPAMAPGLWYYCPSPAGYYPHVQACSSNWVAVDPATVAPPQ